MIHGTSSACDKPIILALERRDNASRTNISTALGNFQDSWQCSMFMLHIRHPLFKQRIALYNVQRGFASSRQEDKHTSVNPSSSFCLSRHRGPCLHACLRLYPRLLYNFKQEILLFAYKQFCAKSRIVLYYQCKTHDSRF